MFIEADDFCKQFDSYVFDNALFKGQRRRSPGLSPSEIITILIMYQHSGYKTFKYFYTDKALPELKGHFPDLTSYPRFVALLGRALFHMYFFALYRCGNSTGISYVDSKKLPVCHNRRIRSHKVFDGIAKRGKSSTGWYFGLKIHLLINHLGDILNFELTPANTQDNNHDLLRKLLRFAKGKVFGDKGYLSTLFEEFYDKGIHLVTKVRSNMKNQLINMQDKLWLLKRGVIDSVNDILMNVLNIEHTPNFGGKVIIG